MRNIILVTPFLCCSLSSGFRVEIRKNSRTTREKYFKGIYTCPHIPPSNCPFTSRRDYPLLSSKEADYAAEQIRT